MQHEFNFGINPAFGKESNQHEPTAVRTLFFISSRFWHAVTETWSHVCIACVLCVVFTCNNCISVWHEFLSTAALLIYIVSCLYNKKHGTWSLCGCFHFLSQRTFTQRFGQLSRDTTVLDCQVHLRTWRL